MSDRPSPSLDQLKATVRSHPDSIEFRRALAERYRAMGNPDQAGRWGILLEGFTTEIERDRLARLLASALLIPTDLRSFLLIPKGQPIPLAVTELLNGAAAEYRVRWGYQGQARQPAGTGGRVEDAATIAFFWLLAIALLVLVAGLVAIWVVAGIGLTDVRFFARLLGAITTSLLCLAALAYAVGAFLEKRPVTGIFVASSAILILGALGIILALRGLSLSWDS